MEAERLPNVARGSVGGNHLDVPASLGELARKRRAHRSDPRRLGRIVVTPELEPTAIACHRSHCELTRGLQLPVARDQIPTLRTLPEYPYA